MRSLQTTSNTDIILNDGASHTAPEYSFGTLCCRVSQREELNHTPLHKAIGIFFEMSWTTDLLLWLFIHRWLKNSPLAWAMFGVQTEHPCYHAAECGEGSTISAGTGEGYSCPTLTWLWYLTILLMPDWLWATNVLSLEIGQTTDWPMLGQLWQADQGSYYLHCWAPSSTCLSRNWRRSRGGLPRPGDQAHVLEAETEGSGIV